MRNVILNLRDSFVCPEAFALAYDMTQQAQIDDDHTSPQYGQGHDLNRSDDREDLRRFSDPQGNTHFHIIRKTKEEEEYV